VAYAHPLKQFVYAPCVNMANVSWDEDRTCASHIMIKTHMHILHLIIQ
jgi:hypothetical protein